MYKCEKLSSLVVISFHDSFFFLSLFSLFFSANMKMENGHNSQWTQIHAQLAGSVIDIQQCYTFNTRESISYFKDKGCDDFKMVSNLSALHASMLFWLS